MPNQHEMTVALSDEEYEALSAAVACGEYASTGDALHDAVSEWRLSRALQTPGVVERLRQLVQEGVESGSAGMVDFDALRMEARVRLKAARSIAANGG